MENIVEFTINPIEKIVDLIFKLTSERIKENSLKNRYINDIKALFVRYENEYYFNSLCKYMTEHKIKYLCDEFSNPITEENYIVILEKFSKELFDICKNDNVKCTSLDIKLFFNNLCKIIKKYLLAHLSENEKIELSIIKNYSDTLYLDIKKLIEEKQADILKNQFKIIQNTDLNTDVVDSIRNIFADEYMEYLFLENKRNDTIRLCDTYIPPNYKINNSYGHDVLSFLDGFVDEKTDEDMLIISGEPAVGKSSLIKRFIFDRREKAKDSNIIVISMKALTYNDNFSQVLCNHFCVPTHHKSSFLSYKTIILDGFDEFCFVNDIQEPDEKIKSIWKNICGKQSGIKMSKIIVTTRSNYLDNINTNKILQISLQPFDESQIKDYTKKFNQIRNDEKCTVSNSIIKSLYDILSVPMILYMSLALNIKLDKNTGKAEIFEKIFGDDGALINNLYKEVDDIKYKKAFLQIPQKIAFQMFKNHTLEYNLSDNIQEDDIFRNLNENQLLHISTYFGTMCYYKDNILQTKCVEFLHKSLYEYYLAKYFFNVLISSKCYNDEEYFASICSTFAWDDFSYINIKKLSKFDSADNNNDIFTHFKYCIENYDTNLLVENKEIIIRRMKKMLEKDFFDSCCYVEYINKKFKSSENNGHKEQFSVINNYVKNIFSMYWNLIFTLITYHSDVCEFFEKDINDFVNSKRFLNFIKQCNGEYFYLKNLKLAHQDFSRHSFVLADFEKTDLTSAYFDESDLRGANFAETELDNASFIYADLMHSDFTNAKLSNVNFVNACLYDAKFKNVTLHHTIFDDKNICVLERQFRDEIDRLENVDIYNISTGKLLTYGQFRKL